MAIWVALAICFGLLYFLRHNGRQTGGKLPPGPKGWPFLGNLPYLAPKPPEQFRQWSKKYGDIMAVRLGYRTVIVISDIDKAKVIFNDDNTTGRDSRALVNGIFKGKGVVPAVGNVWREQRRFALTTLRDLGMGKTWLEDCILDDISSIKAIFKENLGRSYNPSEPTLLAVANVIGTLVFGRQLAYTDKRFPHITSILEKNTEILHAVNTKTQFIPVLQRVPFGKISRAIRGLFTNFQQLWEFVESLVMEHTSSGQVKLEEKDGFIDRFLSIQRQRKNDANSTFTDEQLLAAVLNLFAAGTGTTHATIMWGILLMVCFPDIQQKVQEEIDANVGRDEPVRMEHKALLPFTEATVLEIQRYASVVYLGAPHTVFDDMTIDGYVIPAGTVLNLNSYGLHRDTQYWSHPDDFFPEHFLNTDGTVVIPKGFVPFGIGKRACIGETLARMEFYLILANLLQTFRFSAVSGKKPSPDHCIENFIRTPMPFEIVIHVRECQIV